MHRFYVGLICLVGLFSIYLRQQELETFTNKEKGTKYTVFELACTLQAINTHLDKIDNNEFFLLDVKQFTKHNNEMAVVFTSFNKTLLITRTQGAVVKIGKPYIVKTIINDLIYYEPSTTFIENTEYSGTPGILQDDKLEIKPFMNDNVKLSRYKFPKMSKSYDKVEMSNTMKSVFALYASRKQKSTIVDNNHIRKLLASLTRSTTNSVSEFDATLSSMVQGDVDSDMLEQLQNIIKSNSDIRKYLTVLQSKKH